MIHVGAYDVDGAGGPRRLLGPIDRIKQGGFLWIRKTGGPELRFAGGVVRMPGKEAVSVGRDRTRGKTQGSISSGWWRIGWRKGDGRSMERKASSGITSRWSCVRHIEDG